MDRAFSIPATAAIRQVTFFHQQHGFLDFSGTECCDVLAPVDLFDYWWVGAMLTLFYSRDRCNWRLYPLLWRDFLDVQSDGNNFTGKIHQFVVLIDYAQLHVNTDLGLRWNFDDLISWCYCWEQFVLCEPCARLCTLPKWCCTPLARRWPWR